MKVKCIVSCLDAKGYPALVPVEVDCTQEHVYHGYHQELAQRMANTEGNQAEPDDPVLVFDEFKGPKWLFDRLFPANLPCRYRVIWEIDSDADSPFEAAREADETMREAGNWVFEVVDREGKRTIVDLEQEEEMT
jgi:hypothetical protein